MQRLIRTFLAMLALAALLVAGLGVYAQLTVERSTGRIIQGLVKSSDSIRLMDQVSAEPADQERLVIDGMEQSVREQGRLASRFILLGTLSAVATLFAGGLLLGRRLYRQAEEFQTLRTHFVAIASHELRTPVTSLKMGLDLLASDSMGSLNEEQLAVVAAGVEDCDRLLTLSRQLLDVTKIQSGQLQAYRASVELTPLLVDAVHAVERTAGERRIDIQLDIDQLPSGTRVDADPAKAVWVVTNLLVNALRYAPVDGNVRVSVRVMSLGHIGRKEAAVSVSDTGPGIPAEIARKVFQPYFQGASSAEKKGAIGTGGGGGASGLGLAIAQEIVAAHGGRIWVESVPLLGCGTTVTFTLPLAREEG